MTEEFAGHVIPETHNKGAGELGGQNYSETHLDAAAQQEFDGHRGAETQSDPAVAAASGQCHPETQKPHARGGNLNRPGARP